MTYVVTDMWRFSVADDCGADLSPEQKRAIAKDVCHKLPSFSGKMESAPKSLIGARIEAFVTSRDLSVEGGGLIVLYKPKGSSKTRAAVFGFNELGMWLEGCAVPTVVNE